tara:strand:- start:117 stop:362 length:246 start_codon:yes stop_codon:yes gene_type:complete
MTYIRLLRVLLVITLAPLMLQCATNQGVKSTKAKTKKQIPKKAETFEVADFSIHGPEDSISEINKEGEKTRYSRAFESQIE